MNYLKIVIVILIISTIGFRHQFKNSECGVYSMNFIIRLLNGES